MQPAPPAPRRIALLLEYDGAAYVGSQRQANGPSVQAALEEAIARLSGAATRTVFAGRTDAGVHARGQVAAFSTTAAHTAAVWQRALNALLPADIAVRAVAEAPAGFDPRRAALSRRYTYRLWNAPVRSPLRRRAAWHVREPLALAEMRRALRLLEGEHDFAAFGGPLPAGRSTWRRMLETALHGEAPLLAVELEGSAFLPHQVRRTVGALVEIGRGRLAAERFAGWLAVGPPGAAGPTAPAHGLTLTRVTYRGFGFALPGEAPAAGQEWRDEDLQHQDE